MQIAKLFPKQDCSTFDAYGRIISGTLRPGDQVRLWTVCLVATALSGLP
jgi:U5 small nuclear ribonucleoprotein component